MISLASDGMCEVGLEFIVGVITETFRPAVYFEPPDKGVCRVVKLIKQSEL